MAKKRIAIMMLLSVLLFMQPILPASSQNKGIDRSRIRRPDETVYTVTLTIGTISFDGTLERIDRVTDEQVEQAIREVLKDMELTELDVADMQRLVEKAQSEEQITREDVDTFKENLKTVMGADTAVDIVDLLTGGSGKTVEEIIKDYLSGQVDDVKGDIRDKVLDELIEEGSDLASAADTANKVADIAVIVLDQMEKDIWKQENRVEAANTWRKMQEFYYQVNSKIYNLQTSKVHGWELKIDTETEKNLSFFTIGGNHEKWTVTMLLNKIDKKPADPEGPSGTYTGIVAFMVDYDLTAFDEGFAGYVTSLWQKMMMLSSKSALVETGESLPTEISRWLHLDGKFSIDILAGKPQSAQAAEYTVYPDFSLLTDKKEIRIWRVLKLNGTQKLNKMDLKVAADITYSAENVEKITEHTENYTISGKAYGKTIKETYPFPDSDIGWDNAIWEQWTKEKKLTVKAK